MGQHDGCITQAEFEKRAARRAATSVSPVSEPVPGTADERRSGTPYKLAVPGVRGDTVELHVIAIGTIQLGAVLNAIGDALDRLPGVLRYDIGKAPSGGPTPAKVETVDIRSERERELGRALIAERTGRRFRRAIECDNDEDP